MMMRKILALFALLLVAGTLTGNVAYATNPILKTQNSSLAKTTFDGPVDISCIIEFVPFSNNVNYLYVWFHKKDLDDRSSYICSVTIWDAKSGEMIVQTSTLPSNMCYTAINAYAGENWDINDFKYTMGVRLEK